MLLLSSAIGWLFTLTSPITSVPVTADPLDFDRLAKNMAKFRPRCGGEAWCSRVIILGKSNYLGTLSFLCRWWCSLAFETLRTAVFGLILLCGLHRVCLRMKITRPKLITLTLTLLRRRWNSLRVVQGLQKLRFRSPPFGLVRLWLMTTRATLRPCWTTLRYIVLCGLVTCTVRPSSDRRAAVRGHPLSIVLQ